MVLRVGVLSRADPGWTAGGAFTRTLLTALAATRPGDAEIYFLVDEGVAQPPVPAGVHKVVLPPASLRRFLPLEAHVRASTGVGFHRTSGTRAEAMARRVTARLIGERSPVLSMANALKLDVLLPLGAVAPKPAKPRMVSWIPDFQYLHQPEFFTAQQLQTRRANDALSAANADAVMLSSQDALQDYQAHFPGGAPATVIPFPSWFAFEPPLDAPDVLTRFNIPPWYALVVNQWWAHKNHAVVIEAAAQLKRQGTPVPIVVVGMPLDPRQSNNATASEILQLVARHDLRSGVWLLGMVTLAELHGLMRRAAVLVQPSQFEGWSTSIQDAKALGLPIIASDIRVHREQAPDAFGFFSPKDEGVLARELARTRDQGSRIPNTGIRRVLVPRAVHAGTVYGASLWDLVRKAGAKR